MNRHNINFRNNFVQFNPNISCDSIILQWRNESEHIKKMLKIYNLNLIP